MCEAPPFHHGPRPHLVYPRPHQVLRPRVDALPLPPQNASQLAPDPAIEVFQHTFHFGKPEVRNPTPQYGIETLDCLFQASATRLPQRQSIDSRREVRE